jgi:CubicO group peptidase (beta-lactamase class C family)
VSADFSAVAALLDGARDRRIAPAAVIEVGRTRDVLWQHAAGRLTYEETAAPASVDTLFDLASLTKVVATVPLAMRLVAARRLPLNAPLARMIPGWPAADAAGARVQDLLEHAAGLRAWHPFHRHVSQIDRMVAAIVGLPLEYRPRSRAVYSDLGFLLLGAVIQDAGNAPLDRQFDAVLGSDVLRFAPPAMPGRIAPTEDDRDWRNRLLVGEVHDENAAAIGGVAGHAGLFGTAPAVGAYARLVLRTLRERTPLGEPWLLERFLRPSRVPGSSRALGWDTMRPTSSCGRRLSPAAFGHTGFTGTSLWIDPVKDVYVVLLTNRVHPRRPQGQSDGLTRLRPAIHDAIIAAIERR